MNAIKGNVFSGFLAGLPRPNGVQAAAFAQPHKDSENGTYTFVLTAWFTVTWNPKSIEDTQKLFKLIERAGYRGGFIAGTARGKVSDVARNLTIGVIVNTAARTIAGPGQTTLHASFTIEADHIPAIRLEKWARRIAAAGYRVEGMPQRSPLNQGRVADTNRTLIRGGGNTGAIQQMAAQDRANAQSLISFMRGAHAGITGRDRWAIRWQLHKGGVPTMAVQVTLRSPDVRKPPIGVQQAVFHFKEAANAVLTVAKSRGAEEPNGAMPVHLLPTVAYALGKD